MMHGPTNIRFTVMNLPVSCLHVYQNTVPDIPKYIRVIVTAGRTRETSIILGPDMFALVWFDLVWFGSSYHI